MVLVNIPAWFATEESNEEEKTCSSALEANQRCSDGNSLELLRDIESADKCREKCVEKTGCTHFAFWNGSQGAGNCELCDALPTKPTNAAEGWTTETYELVVCENKSCLTLQPGTNGKWWTADSDANAYVIQRDMGENAEAEC